jgi:hypothetical protein
MSPEFLEALKLVEEYDRQRPKQIIEYRLYYDVTGCVTMYCETDHPQQGNYIVIDNPDVFFKNNTSLMRVVDGKLKILSSQPAHYLGLRRSNTGQRVVKGIASLPLEHNEEYQDVEYYDRKTDN